MSKTPFIVLLLVVVLSPFITIAETITTDTRASINSSASDYQKPVKQKKTTPSRTRLNSTKVKKAPISTPTTIVSGVTTSFVVGSESVLTAGPIPEIIGNDTADTNDILLFSTDIKANNGPATLNKLPVTIRSEGGLLDTVIPLPLAMIKVLKLYANNVLIDSIDMSAGCGPVAFDLNNSCTVAFGGVSNLNYQLLSNISVSLVIKADINDFEDTQSNLTDFDREDLIRTLLTSQNIQNIVVVSKNSNNTIPYQSDLPVVGALRVFK